MEKIKRIIASFVLGILSLPYTIMAQDTGSYIENLGVEDSSYMEEGNPIPAGAESASSDTTVAIIIAAVVVIAVVVFIILRKKKK